MMQRPFYARNTLKYRSRNLNDDGNLFPEQHSTFPLISLGDCPGCDVIVELSGISLGRASEGDIPPTSDNVIAAEGVQSCPFGAQVRWSDGGAVRRELDVGIGAGTYVTIPNPTALTVDFIAEPDAILVPFSSQSGGDAVVTNFDERFIDGIVNACVRKSRVHSDHVRLTKIMDVRITGDASQDTTYVPIPFGAEKLFVYLSPPHENIGLIGPGSPFLHWVDYHNDVAQIIAPIVVVHGEVMYGQEQPVPTSAQYLRVEGDPELDAIITLVWELSY